MRFPQALGDGLIKGIKINHLRSDGWRSAVVTGAQARQRRNKWALKVKGVRF